VVARLLNVTGVQSWQSGTFPSFSANLDIVVERYSYTQ
jgi:hypothetical protein